MKGSLSQRCPAEVLSEIQRRQVSGTMSLSHGGITRQLFIDAGVAIRFAASNHPAESFTAQVVEWAHLDEVRMRAVTSAKQPEELMGTTLVRLGFLRAADFATLTHGHIRQVAQAALAMSEGEWDFQVGALPFRDQIDPGLRTAEVLLAWSRGLSDVEWIRRRLGPDDTRIQRDRRPPEAYQSIRLDPAEGYIMSRVDGMATVREIGMVSPMGDGRTLAALYGLALAGILEMPSGPAFASDPADKADGAPSVEPAPLPHAAGEPAVAIGSPAGGDPARPLRLVPPPPSPPASAAPRAASVPPAPTTPLSQPTSQPPPAAAPPAARAAPSPSAPPAPPGTAPRPVTRFGGARMRPGVRSVGSRPRPAAPRPAGAAPARPAPAAPAAPIAAPPSQGELETEVQRRFEQMDDLDLYQVLGVTPAAGLDEIRRAYYALTHRFHPDRIRREDVKPRAEKVFARITEAYATLSQDDPRRAYDADRAGRKRGAGDDGPADTSDLARENFRTGREHFERGRLAEALGFLTNACQQDPTKAEYLELLGIIQARNPRLRREAEATLLKAIALAPTSAGAHAHLGALYERAGDPDRARDMFRKALQWDPDNAIARKGLEGDEPARKGLFGLFSRR